MNSLNTLSEKPQKTPRNSVIELLRILCILMVIAGHYYAHGIAKGMTPYSLETYSLRILAMQLISFGADIANDLFVIITGYYMINSVMKGKRILKLFAEMLFYAWAIVLVFSGIVFLLSVLDFGYKKRTFLLFRGNVLISWAGRQPAQTVFSFCR